MVEHVGIWGKKSVFEIKMSLKEKNPQDKDKSNNKKIFYSLLPHSL